MIGYLSSDSMVQGVYRGSSRVPPIGMLAPLLQATHGTALNAIHYSTRRPEHLAEEIDRLLHGGETDLSRLCDIVQFNVAWPPVPELVEIRARFSGLRL